MSESIKHIIEPEVNIQHPYLGLSSFHERHKDYFYGRNEEINTLKKIVDRSTLTVFFGKSGLGKSSLLRAGLFPVLRRNYNLPIYLRINFSQSKIRNPIDQIKTELSNAIQAMDEEAPAIGEMSLWEYFHRTKILNGLVKPVLVFDQFEEVFTLGSRDQVDKLFEELGDLIENRVPLSVQKRYGYNIIPFSHQFQNFKVIFSLREDYLAQLENYSALIPSLQKNRYRLHQLNLEHALEAVYEPAKEIIDKKEAQQIVDLLVNDLNESSVTDLEETKNIIEIEPFLLSLICDRINQLRFDSDGNILSEKITSEILDQVDIKLIVADFYKEITSTSSEELNAFIEKHLLTSDGYRRLQPMIDTHELFDVPEQEIQELIDKRILRKEIWNGREQVELIHDVMVPVVRERRDYRIKRERDHEVRMALEQHIEEEEKARIEDRRRQVEKEKHKAEKKKQQRKYIVIAFIIVLLTALFVNHFINQRIDESNKKRDRYIAMSQQLTYKSLSMSFWDSRLKGILARHAYQFATENNSRIDKNIYMSLYNSLEYLEGPGFGEDYKLLKNGSKYNTQLRDFILIDTNLYSMTKFGNILYWNFQNGKPDTITQIDAKCDALGKDLENGYLFIGGKYNQLWVLDLKNNYEKMAIPAGDHIHVILNDNNSNKMFAAGHGGIIYFWTMEKDLNKMVESKDSIMILEGLKDINIMSLASSESLLAVGTEQNGVYLIDKIRLDTTNISFKDKVSGEDKLWISSMSFSSDGEVLAIGNRSGMLMFFDVKSQEYTSFQFHSGVIEDIKYHPNSPLVAVSVSDGSVTLWELNTFERILSMEREICVKQAAHSISFDTSGDNLLVGYDDGSIYTWPINFQKISEDICIALSDKMYDTENGIDSSWLPILKDSEWKKYLNDEIFHDPKYDCPLNKK